MDSSSWLGRILFVLLVTLLVGCGPGLPVGGIVDVEEEPDASGPADAEFERSAQGDDSPWGEGRDDDRSGNAFGTRDSRFSSDDSSPGGTQRWGSDRPMPSDSMPSRTERWGSDRKMPSESMPSRTERWGSDRPMPSDSMLSRTERWGAERRMPSDSMPSGRGAGTEP